MHEGGVSRPVLLSGRLHAGGDNLLYGGVIGLRLSISRPAQCRRGRGEEHAQIVDEAVHEQLSLRSRSNGPRPGVCEVRPDPALTEPSVWAARHEPRRSGAAALVRRHLAPWTCGGWFSSLTIPPVRGRNQGLIASRSWHSVR